MSVARQDLVEAAAVAAADAPRRSLAAQLARHPSVLIGAAILLLMLAVALLAPFLGTVDPTRTVTIEFDANARGPWDFKPAQRSVQVHPGEVATVMYEFRNVQNRTMAAQAIASFAPMNSAAHFNKLECFCFNEYTLQPGESRQWPVVFYVDAKLPKDVTTITLSYTFFEVGGKVPMPPAGGPTTATPGGKQAHVSGAEAGHSS